MRRILITLLAITVFGVGAAFAQSDMGVQYNTTQWAGVGLGYPFQLYYGVNNAIGPKMDVRARLSYGFWNLNFGADVLYTVAQLDSAPVDVYVGGGPNVGFGFYGIGLGLGVSGVVGAEYRINEQFGAFGELGAGYTYWFNGAAGYLFGGFGPRGAIGVNYHF